MHCGLQRVLNTLMLICSPRRPRAEPLARRATRTAHDAPDGLAHEPVDGLGHERVSEDVAVDLDGGEHDERDEPHGERERGEAAGEARNSSEESS